MRGLLLKRNRCEGTAPFNDGQVIEEGSFWAWTVLANAAGARNGASAKNGRNHRLYATALHGAIKACAPSLLESPFNSVDGVYSSSPGARQYLFALLLQVDHGSASQYEGETHPNTVHAFARGSAESADLGEPPLASESKAIATTQAIVRAGQFLWVRILNLLL